MDHKRIKKTFFSLKRENETTALVDFLIVLECGWYWLMLKVGYLSIIFMAYMYIYEIDDRNLNYKLEVLVIALYSIAVC